MTKLIQINIKWEKVIKLLLQFYYDLIFVVLKLHMKYKMDIFKKYD